MRVRLLVAAAMLALAACGGSDDPPEATGPACAPARLHAAAEASGAAAIAFRLEDVTCVEGYAFARVVPLQPMDTAVALFEHGADGWELLNLGTSIGGAADNGIPEDVWIELVPPEMAQGN